MFATHYKNYFLRILLALDEECDAEFSAIVKISEAEDLNPIATLCLPLSMRSACRVE